MQRFAIERLYPSRRLITGLHLIAVALLLTLSATTQAKKLQGVGGPFDLAIANEDRLLEMLKRSGKIGPQATAQEAEQAVRALLLAHQRKSQSMPQDLPDSLVEQRGPGGEQHRHQHLQKGFHFGGHGRQSHCDHSGWHASWRIGTLDCVELEDYVGEKHTARILSILIEFPDFPHNTVEEWETDNYFNDYTQEHYDDLLFSPTGSTGPQGQNLISMLQYYDQQSGGSYNVEGVVAGWYMASQPAAYYGNNVDGDARALVAEALLAAAADPNVNLEDFDLEDRYDLDGDGDLWEPDGIIDHVQVFHSSVGEEAGGGQLGEDAVWSHRWNLGGLLALPGTSTDVPSWGGVLVAYDYTIQPIDAAAGVVSHEYGHDLGLPDEYDTEYTGRGEPVSFWSIMSSGSWAGDIPGTEPTGFSAWSKEFLQEGWGGNWLTGETINFDDISWWGESALLDQAVSKGTNNDAVRINLPDKKVVAVTPTSGSLAYFSGSGDNLGNSMSATVDLSGATTATLTFKAWYDIELNWDHAYVMVDGNPIAGNITTTDDPNGQNFGNGITGASGGWVDAEFDLSAYAGNTIDLTFYYWTDGYVSNPGLYVDDIVVSTDAGVVFADDAEDTPAFSLAGFTQNPGYSFFPHYYLLEWRTHQGIDKGLAHVKASHETLPFNEGMLVWYVDSSYSENWVGIHPGNGFLGVVDADQHVNYWSDGEVASTRYQVHDAAFSLNFSDPVYLDLTDVLGATLTDFYIHPVPKFNDHRSYISNEIPDAGREIPRYGLKIRVLDQSPDKSVAKIHISK